MRALGVVVDEPHVHVGLQFLDACVELGAESLSEDLVQDGSVEPFDKSVGPRAFDLGTLVPDVAQAQIQLERVSIRSAKLPAIIGEDLGNGNLPLRIKRQHVVVRVQARLRSTATAASGCLLVCRKPKA